MDLCLKIHDETRMSNDWATSVKIDAVHILRWLQEEYLSIQKKLVMCLVNMEKDFDRVTRKVVEFEMRKKGISEALGTAVMGLFKGA